VTPKADEARARPAEIVREYGPFPGADVAGVTYDGKHVWFAAGARLESFEASSGKPGRTLPVKADAGTAFDGRHLYQLSGGHIQKIDPETGTVVSTIPSPQGADAGLTWAEGTLWVAKHRERKIYQVDPRTGKVLRTIESTRFVTGVTFVDGELWHGTWEDGQSELRRVDSESGRVVERLSMPPGTIVSGLESNGSDVFYCGGGTSGKVRAVRRPK
jgi:outer membrane protein assembly factor BamB